MACMLFAFVGAKGGSGTSTLCAEAARTLKLDGSVSLVDADLSGRRSAAILFNAFHQLDASRDLQPKIATARVDGVTLLEIANSYSSAFTISQDDVESLARSLDETGIVLVDMPAPFAATVRPFIVRAARFIVVTERTVMGLASARTMVDELKRFGIPSNRIVLLLNLRDSLATVSRDQVERAFQERIAAEIPALTDRGYRRAIAGFARTLRSVSAEPSIDTLLPSSSGAARDRRLVPRSSAPAFAAGTGERTAVEPGDAAPSQDKLDARERLKADIHEALAANIDLIDASKVQGDAAKMVELRANIAGVADQMLQHQHAIDSAEDVARLKEEIVDEALGLGPLEDLMRDPAVTEIMVNGAANVYIERRGLIERSSKHFASEQQLRLIIERIIMPLGRRVDESVPMVDARLPDGSRVNAIIPPLSVDGATLTIRRFGTKRLTEQDLLAGDSLTAEMHDFLRACVQARLNVVISGGTGSGKTTFLNILSGCIPVRERIVTIEDAAELCLNQPHVVRLEARPANLEGRGEVKIRDLVRNALRMRPDRIVVGEARGAEALDMLQAMNTGHDGSLTTIHANTARDSLSRIETMVMMAGFELPVRAIREQVASAVDLVIQTSRMRDGTRKITSISEVVGMEGDIVTMQELVRYTQHGVDTNNRVVGAFQYTGVQPQALRRFEEYGVKFDIRSLANMAATASIW